MHRINCPWCGLRDQSEFAYQGDAGCPRPREDASEADFHAHVYVRENPKGWHREWWHHVGGCRLWIQVARNTLTHEIHATARAGERLPFPQSDDRK